MLTSASDQGSGRAPGAGVPYQDPALDPDHEAVDLALESDLAQLAWALGRVGWLLVLVGLVVAGLNLLPLQPWEGSWWRALAGVLLQAAPLPLLGSSLVHLGAFLDPADRLLLRRLRRVRRGAALLAVLFLLLVPLQLWTGWSVDRLSSGARDRAEQKLSRRFLALQSAVATSSTIPELRERLVLLQGPSLAPEADALPFPLVKRRLLLALERSQPFVQEKVAAEFGARSVASQSLEVLRIVLPALLYAIAFATLSPLAPFSIAATWWPAGFPGGLRSRARRRRVEEVDAYLSDAVDGDADAFSSEIFPVGRNGGSSP